ncbi:MAG TPA: DUF268 domain-containing protein [Pedobacter sp.]|jgi:hypothetical protein
MIKNLKWVIINQFGINPKKFFLGFFRLIRYYKEYRQFRKNYKGRITFQPCLHDSYDDAGDTKSEYFIQDLHVAQLINISNPHKHVDVGSRIDGFVANIASSREIEILDIRTVEISVKNINFNQCDIMETSSRYHNYTDSLSCLHSLEHFGLGRYGDPINPVGYIAAFNNLAAMLINNGLFYLSIPLGIEQVQFNAYRIFSYNSIIDLSTNANLKLEDFYLVRDGKLIQRLDFDNLSNDLEKVTHVLAIFVFRKILSSYN